MESHDPAGEVITKECWIARGDIGPELPESRALVELRLQDVEPGIVEWPRGSSIRPNGQTPIRRRVIAVHISEQAVAPKRREGVRRVADQLRDGEKHQLLRLRPSD